MAHYFENDASAEDHPLRYSFELGGRTFSLASNSGVFSSQKLDTGTRILLECVLEQQKPEDAVLDLGCGIGVVGVVLGTFWNCHPVLIDVNERACQLAEENLKQAGVQGSVLCQDGIESGSYACILLNPPIRTGKQVMFRLYEQALHHLQEEGSLWIVIRKQHGAESTVKFLQSLHADVRRAVREKGYWVLQVRHLN